MEHTHLFLLVAFFLVHSPLLLLTPLMDTTPQSAPVTVPLRRDVVTTAVAISYAGELPRTECRCICDHCAREEIEHLEYGCFRRHYFAIPPCRECAFIEKYGATTWWFTHSALEQRHLLMHVRALSKLDGSRVTCATDYACASPSTQWIALSAPFWVLVMVMEFIGNKTSDAESKAVAMAADTLVYADAAAPEELGRTILKKNIMNSLTTTLRPALFFCRCITRFILKNLSSNNPNSLIANKLKLATTILDDNEKQLGGCLCLIPIIQELVAVLPRGYSDRYYLNLCEHLVSADFKCVRFQTLTCDNTCPGSLGLIDYLFVVMHC